MQEQNKYLFEVATEANKMQIKEAVEVTFGVNVLKVNTMHMRGHEKRFGRRQQPGKSPDWKKAIVTLREGQSIKYFDQQ